MYSQPRNYDKVSIVNDVPISAVSATIIKPISTVNRIIRANSAGGDTSLGGSCSIRIAPTQNTAIKANSCYLNMLVKVALPIVAGAATNWAFKNGIQGASSLINKLTISSGVPLETIDSYADVHALAVIHGSNTSYISDVAVQEYSGNVFESPINVATSVNEFWVSFPLVSGILSSGYDIPLYLMSAGLTIDINWQTSTAMTAWSAGLAAALTGITLSNVGLVYESIQFEDSFCSAQKQLLMEGSTYSIPYTTHLVNLKSSEANLNYTIGLNKASVLAMLYTSYIANATTAQRLYKSGALTSLQVYADGQLVNYCGTLDATSNCAMVFNEMQRAMSCLSDTSVCSIITGAFTSLNEQSTGLHLHGAISTPGGSYLTTTFLAGINLKRTQESFALSGTPINSMDVVAAQTVVAGDITLIDVLYNAIMVIDGAGVVARLC